MIIKDFNNWYKGECLGIKARLSAVITLKSSQQQLQKHQRRRRVHVEYCKELMLVEIPSGENICKERELKYEDGREVSGGSKFSSIQRELRSMAV